jgi:hypothetical protein
MKPPWIQIATTSYGQNEVLKYAYVRTLHGALLYTAEEQKAPNLAAKGASVAANPIPDGSAIAEEEPCGLRENLSPPKILRRDKNE